MDHAIEGDGKEFFTVNTQEGNVFYLVIDRQRSQENVYLLNTVTEQDLMALADESAGISAIPTPAPPEPTPSPTPSPPPPTATPEPVEEPPARSSNNGMILLLVIVVIGVGGAGYYFKVVKGRKETEDIGNEEYEDEYGYGEDTEAEDGYDAEDGQEEDEA